jgi:hypothetical protein
MASVTIHKTMDKDGEIFLTGLPFQEGEDVELTVSSEEKLKTGGLTFRKLLESGIVGMWKDRDDIGDSVEFARKLRERAQRREH